MTVRMVMVVVRFRCFKGVKDWPLPTCAPLPNMLPVVRVSVQATLYTVLEWIVLDTEHCTACCPFRQCVQCCVLLDALAVCALVAGVCDIHTDCDDNFDCISETCTACVGAKTRANGVNAGKAIGAVHACLREPAHCQLLA
jgi:hypothetical protein